MMPVDQSLLVVLFKIKSSCYKPQIKLLILVEFLGVAGTIQVGY